MTEKSYDLWRPYYEKGDTVWVRTKDGRFFSGIVLRRYKSAQVSHNNKTKIIHGGHLMYYVHVPDAAEVHAGISRRKYSIYVSHAQLWPRKPNDAIPFEHIHRDILTEETLALLQQANDHTRARLGKDENGGGPVGLRKPRANKRKSPRSNSHGASAPGAESGSPEN